MGTAQEIAEEQVLLDRAYEGIEAMRRDAQAMLDEVIDLERGGTFQSRTERDIVVRTSLARLAQLDVGDQTLCFGRIDRAPAEGVVGEPLGESFHIGRMGVTGPDREPLVVDWRAPVAAPFYRATGLDPQGLARRRHLAVRRRKVEAVEDEWFGAGAHAHAVGNGHADALLEGGLGGAGALLSAMAAPRTGQMGDIVATIQREQDEIIRAPQGGLLMVQGGPGTGKTAVALHRAAYLLYTNRFPLERQGVLVVGPNPLFLGYIESVLPSLGETGVHLTTVAGLVGEIRVRATETLRRARLKGDARMAKVMMRAVRTRERPLRDDVDIPFGGTTLRLRREATAEIIHRARRRPGTHNARRRFVEGAVVGELVGLWEAYVARTGAGRGGLDVAEETEDAEAPETEAAAHRAEVERDLGRHARVKESLDRMWPRLGGAELIHDLLGAPALLRAAGKGILSEGEIELLHRGRSESLEKVGWTEGDAGLVDEARELLGPRSGGRRRKGRPAGRPWGGETTPGWWPVGLGEEPAMAAMGGPIHEDIQETFGHIVVDEVQDLSPMELRMIARRSLSSSMTVVGDIGQATGAWAPGSWDSVARGLVGGKKAEGARRVELTVSYRTPGEVMAAAGRVLALGAPELRPPRAARRGGRDPIFLDVDAGAVTSEVVAQVRALRGSLEAGQVAVLVPEGRVEEFVDALGTDGAVDPREKNSGGLTAGLVVLPAAEANGLEFDGVVVVEPEEIAGGTRRGIRAVYVGVTRTTRALVVVGSKTAGEVWGALVGRE